MPNPEPEERDVQVDARVAQHRVAFGRAGPGPEVDVAHPDGEERHEEECEERERARRRLEDAPHHHAPRAAREVVEHEDRERPQRDAEAVEPTDQPAAEEVGPAREPDDRGDDAGSERGEADDERALLEALEPEGRSGPRAHRAPSVSSACRTAGGTSASDACWLRWSARI